MKKPLLTLLFIACFTSSFASHIAGGDIRYEFNGVNYTVYLTLTGDCGPNSIPFGGTLPIDFSSVSTSNSFQRQFAMTSVEYPAQSCTSNPCSPSAPLPGYAVARFIDTVTLPPAADWVISVPPANARTTAVNLSGPGSSFYVETTLNNSSAPNSTPRLPDWPTIYVGNYFYFPVYFPLNTVDPDGDSIAYELVDPMVDATTSVFYGSGYSSTYPLGSNGIYKVTNNRKAIQVKGDMLGAHALALKIKEYRNNTLIASHMREFTVSITNLFATPQTIPVATTSSVFNISTCPGQSNNIILNFIDSSATDSVYVAVTPPSMSGWIFNTVTSAAPGAGSATISWTTPASANPATLKQFVIKLTVRDNTCPIRSIMDYYVTVQLQSCSADSVWPGDANGDNTVNLYDPLYIGIAHGKTGPSRTAATSTWTPQACAPWTNSFLINNTNIKHADCNGDGVINNADLAAVANNYGQFHLKGGDQEKTTGVPELYFDLTNVVLLPGAPASIPIRTGSAASTINNLYGVATCIRIDGLNPSTSLLVNTSASWLGSNSLNFNYPVSATTVDWSHVRTDQQEVFGHGIVGVLNFTVPVSAQQNQNVVLQFELAKLIDKDGHDIPFNTVNGGLTVGFPVNVNEPLSTIQAMVVPNPSGNNASLYLSTDKTGMVDVSITNVMGQQVWSHQYNAVAGNNSFLLPADTAPGLYSVHINDHAASRTIKWIKQQ